MQILPLCHLHLVAASYTCALDSFEVIYTVHIAKYQNEAMPMNNVMFWHLECEVLDMMLNSGLFQGFYETEFLIRSLLLSKLHPKC